jgi:hypothetical protein
MSRDPRVSIRIGIIGGLAESSLRLPDRRLDGYTWRLHWSDEAILLRIRVLLLVLILILRLRRGGDIRVQVRARACNLRLLRLRHLHSRHRIRDGIEDVLGRLLRRHWLARLLWTHRLLRSIRGHLHSTLLIHLPGKFILRYPA